MAVFPQYHDVVAAVPEYDRYLTVSELEGSTDESVATHPATRVRQAGASRAGLPIRCIEVPGGPLHAVLVGAPHPEEPVGTLVLEHLLPLLADGLADELGMGFSVVKIGDPDGMRLNEPWFDDPYDLAGFILRAYRPAFIDQFEWTFPVEYKRYAFTKPLPEARAVMEVVHRQPVDFYMCLHNTNFGGAYFYLSEEDEALQLELTAVMRAAGIPPHCGEPEMPYLRTYADGIFAAFALADDYDYYEAYGVDPAAAMNSGTSSDGYAQSVWDCSTLVAEVPYFSAPKIADKAPAGLSRREAKLRGIELERGYAGWLHERYVEAASKLTGESPWQRSLFGYLESAADDLRAEQRQTEHEPAFDREATVAELLDSVYLRELAALQQVGRLVQMVAAEPEQDASLAALREEAEAKVRDRAPQLASACGLQPVPIRALVQCQLAALLCSLVAVRKHHERGRARPTAPLRPLP